jgi:4-hydroxy-tetrahydrodipicolinate synthase
MKALQGTGVALVTPFNEDFSIDFDGLERLISHVSPFVDYLVVHGTTGEASTTTFEEKKQIFDFIKSHNKSKLPLVYGIGANNTQAVLDLMAATNLDGVTALLSVSPYYNKPTQEGIYQHYSRIADACPIPVVLYNVPGRTMSNVETETTLRLSAHPNIIGVKEASGDINQCREIANKSAKDFLLISGDDMATKDIIQVGGSGVISVIANALPQQMDNIVKAGLQGNFDAAREATHLLQDINPLLYDESNPVGVKEILRLQQVCGNQVRLPLLRATKALKSRIQEELSKL